MVSASVVLCVSEPLVPVIVSVVRVRRRAFDAVTVNVEVVAVGFGANEPLSPVPNPVALSDTEPANPFFGVIVTVYVDVPVRAIVLEVGETAIVKSDAGTAWTTRVAETECVVPLVPVIVNG